MKKKELFILCGIVAVLTVAGAIFWQNIVCLLSPEVVTGSLAFAGFVGATQEQTVQGTQQTTLPGSDTDDFKSPEHNKPTISQRLSKIMPSATPLDTILREVDSVPCKSQKFEYYSVNSRGVSTKVAAPNTEGSTGGLAEVNVATEHMFSVDGNLLVPSFSASGPNEEAKAVASGISFSPLVLHIVSIDRAAHKLTVFAVNANKVPVLPADTLLYRMGVAKNELAAISDDPSALPTKDYNYCQIHMTTVSEGVYQAMQEKEIQYGLLDLKEQALLDFRMTNEVDSLFGYKREFYDPVTQKTKYMSDGMIRKITKHLDKGSASGITNDVLIGWAADIFTGNNGSDKRICFYGPEFGVALARATTVQKQLEAAKTEVVYGMTFNRIETVHGTLLMKMHNAFGLYGYSAAAMVIDPANIARAQQKPLEANRLDLDKTGQSRANAIRIDESHTLMVTNPDTHAMLYAE